MHEAAGSSGCGNSFFWFPNKKFGNQSTSLGPGRSLNSSLEVMPSASMR